MFFYRMTCALALFVASGIAASLAWFHPNLDLSSWSGFLASDLDAKALTLATAMTAAKALWYAGTAGDSIPADDEGHLSIMDLYDNRV